MIRALGVESVYNHADFRLLSRKAVEALKDFREVNLFLRGIVPLRFISVLGFLVFLLFSAAMGVWTVSVRLFTERAVPGWTSTLLPIYVLGGLQILCIGVLGEYLGKVYQETKRRPRYLIEKVL